MEKLLKLEKLIQSYESVLVGFSAGVDSTLVSFVANKVLGPKALIVLAKTETIIEEDVELARKIAKKHGFNYREIEYSELEIDYYANNPVNRCYFCKKELYNQLKKIAFEEKINFILDGANVDDLGDYRPGRIAAREKEVKSPLIECGFTKADVRHTASLLELPNYDKPSAPCLSSRIPYGTRIDKKSLKMIAEAEKFLRKLGFINVRVRHYQDKAKIEVDSYLIPELKKLFQHIDKKFKEIGYTFIEIDPEGFQSGKLNRDIISKIPIIK